MKELVVTQDSTAAPAELWSVLTDIDNAAATISAIAKIERLDDGSGFGVGTTWRETRTLFGKTATEDMKVSSVDPGRSYVTEASSHGADYRTVYSVDAAAGGSRITVRFGAESTSGLAKVMAATVGKLFARATRKVLEKDLAEIAAAAEAVG